MGNTLYNPLLPYEELKKLLALDPLYGEGGNFRRTYLSDEVLPAQASSGALLPGRSVDPDGRALGSAILYTITKDTFSRMHRLVSDEIYHFYMGAPVEMLQLYPDGTGKVFRMGHDLAAGELVQLVVPRGVWQGVHLADSAGSAGTGEYALIGTTMAPAYAPSDYEDGDKQQLIAQYPQYSAHLEILAGAPRY